MAWKLWYLQEYYICMFICQGPSNEIGPKIGLNKTQSMDKDLKARVRVIPYLLFVCLVSSFIELLFVFFFTSPGSSHLCVHYISINFRLCSASGNNGDCAMNNQKKAAKPKAFCLIALFNCVIYLNLAFGLTDSPFWRCSWSLIEYR